MARKQQTLDPPRSTATRRDGRAVPRAAVAALATSVLAAVWAAMMLTSVGQILYVSTFIVAEFYAGVVTLVLLTLTVLAGVAATDRSVLMIRHRVLLQSTHRATGMVAVGALGLHVLTKIAAARAGVLDALLPFASGRGLYLGLGTLAGYAMVAVLWTGVVRLRFAGRGRPWMWRALHSAAYVSWPVALVHGLNAGRTPATWVTLSYLLCGLLVVAALLVRLSASLGRKRRDSAGRSVVAPAADEPVTDRGRAGAWVPGRRPVSDLRVGRDVATEPDARPAAVLDSWAPAASYRNVASPRRRSTRFAVPRVPASVADEPPAWRADEPPAWRADAGPATAVPSGTDRTEVPEEPWTSPRRWSAPAPEPAGNYWEAPTGWRRYADEPATDSGRPVSGPRHSRDDRDEEAEYPPPLPDDDTPTLVDLASRRARREAEGTTRSARRRRATAEAVDSAYWARLRGEAK